MNITKLAGIAVLIPFFVLGCSGNYANLKPLKMSESNITQQELIDNWSDYNIRYNNLVIIFDPKNDDKKIIVGNYWWSTVEDQETLTQLVNGTKKLPKGYINQVWGNEIREIWVSDSQLYGYFTQHQNELVSAQIIDENTVRFFHSPSVDRRVH